MCQRFPEELDDILGADDEEEQDTGAHFTCFTGAKVQILTHLTLYLLYWCKSTDTDDTLLALLVQKYRY
jgi:hypothetical protein